MRVEAGKRPEQHRHQDEVGLAHERKSQALHPPISLNFFGCTYVPRLCSRCYLVAGDTGWYATGRYSTVPFCALADFVLRCTYYFVCFLPSRRFFVACFVFCDHGPDLRKMIQCQDIIMIIINCRCYRTQTSYTGRTH